MSEDLNQPPYEPEKLNCWHRLQTACLELSEDDLLRVRKSAANAPTACPWLSEEFIPVIDSALAIMRFEATAEGICVLSIAVYDALILALWCGSLSYEQNPVAHAIQIELLNLLCRAKPSPV